MTPVLVRNEPYGAAGPGRGVGDNMTRRVLRGVRGQGASCAPAADRYGRTVHKPCASQACCSALLAYPSALAWFVPVLLQGGWDTELYFISGELHTRPAGHNHEER